MADRSRSLETFVRRHRTAIWIVTGTLVVSLIGWAVDRSSRDPFTGNQARCMDDLAQYGRDVLDTKRDSASVDVFLRSLYAAAASAGMSDAGINAAGDYVVRSVRTNGRFLFTNAAVTIAQRACASRGDRH